MNQVCGEPTTHDLSRRSVLGGTCAGCAALLLSACGGSATPPAGRSRAAGNQALAELSAIPVGGSISARAPDGKPLLLARPTAATVVAFRAVCTHQGCTVEPAGAVFGCPCHDASYDAFTGKVLSGPAPLPLPPYPVKVVGTSVVPA